MVRTTARVLPAPMQPVIKVALVTITPRLYLVMAELRLIYTQALKRLHVVA